MVAQVDARYRSFGMGRYARRLFSYAMFEGRPLTTRGRFFNPVVFAWLRLLAAWPGQPRVRRPIFITGLGRSGTTILGVLLSLHRDVGFLNEPKALWHLVDPRQDLNGNYAAAGGVYRLGAGDAGARAQCTAHRLFARYLTMSRSTRVLDKYPELIFRADYVLSLFPDAKLIFITRSGADAVPSVVKWSERLGVQTHAGTDDWWGRNDVKWHYLRKELILGDPAYRAVWPLATASLDQTNRAALEWILTMREGLAQERAHPGAVVRMAYESLLADPAAELDRLQRQCGLEPDPAVATYARERVYENPTKSRPVLLPAVEALFTSTMHELGFEY
jgi:hypothetical protein